MQQKSDASLTQTDDEPGSTAGPIDCRWVSRVLAGRYGFRGDRSTAGDMLDEADIELEPYLAVVIQIEVEMQRLQRLRLSASPKRMLDILRWQEWFT